MTQRALMHHAVAIEAYHYWQMGELPLYATLETSCSWGVPIFGQRLAALLVKFCNGCDGVSPILTIIHILNIEYIFLSAVHLLLFLALVHRIRLLHIRDSW